MTSQPGAAEPREQPKIRKIRVVIADDQALVRAGLRSLLEDDDGLEVVGEARDGAQAVALAASLRPDVVLMDIRMPDVDGIEATRRIAQDPALGGVHVVILTTFELDGYVVGALRAGAAGFLVKDSEPDDLLRGIRVAAGGDSLLSPGVTRRLIARFVSRPEPASPPELSVLTDREREVLALVATGLSNEEIAERLIVSPATAKTHVSRTMVKLHARDRAQLVVFAYESGLVHPVRVQGDSQGA